MKNLSLLPSLAQNLLPTTTIDGDYIPNPPPTLGGKINLNAKASQPWWPPNIIPPKGAPNILLTMTDDQVTGSQACSVTSFRRPTFLWNEARDQGHD
jgi:hypothetical protein